MILTDAIATRMIDRIVAQPGPRDALLRFLYYTEEFVERFELDAILPHLDEAEGAALLQHFAEERGHARALRALCQRQGLRIERSPAEEALIQRSDEGYAQYLRHLDPKTRDPKAKRRLVEQHFFRVAGNAVAKRLLAPPPGAKNLPPPGRTRFDGSGFPYPTDMPDPYFAAPASLGVSRNDSRAGAGPGPRTRTRWPPRCAARLIVRCATGAGRVE